MTREEAINNLNMINFAFVEAETKEQREIIDDTFNMAIKALEQEPCEDAISRQAVLDELNKWDWQELYLPIHFKENIIDVVPSVKPQEPKTGHWKRIGYDIYECSICGQNVMTGDICAYKHCHGCGAKMESEVSE